MSKRYEIREQIGKGGLGTVYKAFDTQLQREVAMKRVLPPDQASDEEVKEAADKLIAEAQTLSTLNHPNIITVFDVGQDEDGGFVVMELLKGETLDETISRGVLTEDDFTEIVYQTMEALIAAQANNVIHRDIKPTNIMVIWQASGKFQTKILDFGLAKFSKSPSVQTMDQEDSVLGSIFFMAPEQFERGELDARTDIYQMGCVYYNALTGQYPFNGDTAPQVMNAHLQHKVIPLEQIRPDLPPSVCQWVMWLINRDIEHRPEDARDALKRWPRNPEPAGAVPVAKALPVEDTPRVASDAVKIATAEGQASAPPALVVRADTGSTPTGATTGRLNTGATTGRLQTGATTGRLRTGATTGRLNTGATTGRLQTATGKSRPGAAATGTIGGGRPNLRTKPAAKKSSHKGKWIVLVSIIVIAGIAFAVRSAKRAAAEEQKQRIIALASDDGPEATLSDVGLAIDFLAAAETTPSLRSDAMEVLEKAEGEDVNRLIHDRLKVAEGTTMQMRLSGVLSEKGYSEAVPTILTAFDQASGDKEKVNLLSSVRAIASMEQVGQILNSLKGDHSQSVRQVFEDTVLAVLRKSESRDKVVSDILTRLSNTSGPERKSLFRILGGLGGKDVENRMASVYSKTNDTEYQEDAMLAYLNWKDRSAIPEVEKIIESTNNNLLKIAAVKALLRLSSLPGKESEADRIALWKRVFELNTNPNDARRLIALTLEYPSPQAVALLKEWSTDEKFGSLAKGTLQTMQKLLSSVPEIGTGEELKGSKARVQGDNRAAINSFVESLTSWTSPDTWFSWNFKVKEAGEYAIQVDQATLRKDPSEFIAYLAEKKFTGTSVPTDTLEEFTPITLGGTVSLEKGKVYTLIIAAGDRVQPRMMDIGAVRLVKPGGGE